MKNIPLYEVDEINDLREMLLNSERKYGSKAAFLRKKNISMPYEPITYAQFKSDVYAFGTKLLDMGCKGQRIAVIGENRYEWSVSYLAVVNGLGVIVPLDRELPENEIILSLNRAEVETVIFSNKLADKILPALSEVKLLKNLIIMGDGADSDERVIHFDDLLAKGHALIDSGADQYGKLDIDVDAMSILLFTSGTTDLSKAVMLSHRNICSNIMAMSSMVYIDDKDIFLSILPIHHTYECTCGYLCPIYRGSTVAYFDGLRHIPQNIQEANVTMMLGVPLIFETMHRRIFDTIRKNKMTKKVRFAMKLSNLLRKFGIDKTRTLFKAVYASLGNNLRLFISGAAAIDPQVSKDFKALGINTIQGYGLTECAPIAAVNRDCDNNDSAAGLAMPGVDVHIEDSVNGIGEIVIKGPNVMLGYYNDEEATRKAIDERGFFHSGDLGYIDKDGFVHITGRKKNVIVTKNGKNVFPEEIETLLLKSPYISEVIVYGDDVDGETVVKAHIFPNFDRIKEDTDKQSISGDVYSVIQNVVKGVNKQLVLYKAVKDFNIRDNEFVKTTTKKIKRYVKDNV